VGHAHVLRTVPEEAFGGKTVALLEQRSNPLDSPPSLGKRCANNPPI